MSAPINEVSYSCEARQGFRALPPSLYTVMGRRKLPINEQGRLYWHIMNFGQDIDPALQVGIFAKAFGDWQEHLFPWRFTSTSDPNKCDWPIFHAVKNKIHLPDQVIDSPYDFLGNPSVLAVQYEYAPGFDWSLAMIVNDDHKLGLQHEGKTFDVYKIIRHEIGHGLRLGHTNVKGDLMYPIYDPHYTFTKDTINGLMHVHGPHLMEFAELDRAKRFINLYLSSGKPRIKKKSWWRRIWR